MEYRVLGPVEAVDGDARREVAAGRQLALLALLVLHANRTVTTDRILDDLWGDEPPDSGAKAVGFHVSKLRDALMPGRGRNGASGAGGAAGSTPAVGAPDPGRQVLVTVDGGYRLDVAPGQLDADRFERLAVEGRGLLASDPARTMERLDGALAEWRGPAYAQLADEPFLQAEIARLEELRLRAQEDRFDALLALGRHADAIPGLAAHVAANPLREHPRAALATALYRAGRQADALRTLADGRRVLDEELGIEPGPELRQLETRVLAQDADLAAPGRMGDGGTLRNPYKGLRPFDEADSADFFGRETLVASLVERLASLVRGSRLLVLVGPSGSGKSSVARAGLVAAIRDGRVAGLDGAVVDVLLPGSRPREDLAAALLRLESTPARLSESAAASPPAVLVVDQVEELPALAGNDETLAFLGALEAALVRQAPPLVVIATVRADSIELPLAVPGLAERVRTGTEIVGAMQRGDLERAIARPAERVGLSLEPGLAHEIAGDVGTQPGALPLLQFALTELFERRDGARLTRAQYAASGRVEGALAARAEDAWRALHAGDREVARQVLLRLVSVTESGDAVGRRCPRAGLVAHVPQADADRVVDLLARHRLLALDRDATSGEPVVGIAHDALLVRWARLAAWIRDARDDLAMRRRLGSATADWEAAGRGEAFLLEGARLDLFEAWSATTALVLDPGDRALLDASLEERRREQEAEQLRRDRERALERRARTRLRALAAVLAAGILLVSGLSVAVYRQAQGAAEQERVAVARERAAASVGSLAADPRLALLLAWHAADATVDLGFITQEAYDALHWALQASHVAYPASDAAVGVRSGPGGPTGVPLLAPDALMSLVAAQPGRSLDAAECRTYLHAASCGAMAAADGTRGLDVLAGSDLVTADALAVPGLAGASVDVRSSLPVDIGPALADLLASTGVTVRTAGTGTGASGAGASAGMSSNGAARAPGSLGPDLLILDRPADLPGLVASADAVPLDGILDAQQLHAAAGDYLVAMGRVGAGGAWPSAGGAQYGVPFAITDESLLWTAADAGAPPPASWAEVVGRARAAASQGRAGWCLGLAGDGTSPGSGSVDLAGVFEDQLLAAGGTEAYDAWASGYLAGGDQAARVAFRRLADVLDPSVVLGGLGRARATPVGISAWPMLETPSACLYHPGGGRERLDWYRDPSVMPLAVPVPGSERGAAGPVRGRAYMVVVLHDRPEVRQALAALLGRGADSVFGPALARAGLWRPGSATGPEPERGVLDAAVRSGRYRVSLGDIVPAPVERAYAEGIDRFADGEESGYALFEGGLAQAWTQAVHATDSTLAGG